MDARDAGQFSGAVTRGDGKPGHIPGATNLHADLLLGDGGFVPGEEAEGKYAETNRTDGASGSTSIEVRGVCGSDVPRSCEVFRLREK